MTDTGRRRLHRPLLLGLLVILVVLTVTLVVVVKRDLDNVARILSPNRSTPTPAKPTASTSPSGISPESRIDLRDVAVAVARDRNKAEADHLVKRLQEKGALRIEPAGRYLMYHDDWYGMSNEQKPAMATVFLLHNNLQPVKIFEIESGDQLGAFQVTPSTQPAK